LRITRYPNLTPSQFFGCVAAFVDSLSGELNAAASALRRLEGQRKGAAFAYEMTLDHHRYGALIVLDRWSTVVQAFGPHLELPRNAGIVEHGGARIHDAQETLTRANDLIDAAGSYTPGVVQACLMAWQSLNVTFAEERRETEESAKLGPMLPEEYRDYRRIFLEDLAVR
jgi:hypothetical protein